ncbi:hypothetical protein LTR85_000042 [Meristemomyces frigidus]|nr:hypothetical protein LTR85_000042 [Meristemomyces frigidus]
MPPKTTVPPHQESKGPSKQELDAINTYLAQKPDFNKLIDEAKQNPQTLPKKQETDYDAKLHEALRSRAKMPVMPKEDEAPSGIFDKVAKESDDSTASTHKHHQGETQTMATMEDHQAQPGPVLAEKMEAPASKEDLKKRAEELNK